MHPGYGFPGCQCDFTDDNYDSAWTNSRCILLSANTPYSFGYCDPKNTTNIPLHANNSIYTVNGTATYQCGDSSLTLQQWQALGVDSGTTEAATPPVKQVIQWASEILYLKSGYAVEVESEVSRVKSAVVER